MREAVFAGRYAEADALAKKMQGPYNQSYQPLGDLLVDFDVPGEVEGYRRELDLDRAIATTSFRAGGATHTREVFASFPDQVIVVRVSADRPGRVSFTARLASRLRHATAAEGAGGHRPAGPRAEPRRPELPRRHEGRGPVRRRPGRRGHAVHRDRAGDRARGDDPHDARGPARGARGRRGRPVRVGRHELQRLRQVARRRGQGPRCRGTTAARRRRGEASRRAARRARRRPRAPLRPGAPRPRRAARGASHRRASPGLPPRRGPRSRRPRLPVRPLPPRRELPPRHPAREPAGHLERGRPPAVELELDAEHQQRDELLAGGGDEPLRVPRADAEDDRRARAQRTGDGAGQLRGAGLGGPPQRRPVAADGPRRELGPGRPEVGELADGCGLALDGPVGALRVHARRGMAARLRLAAPPRRGRVRSRLARPRREGRPRHRTVAVAGERVPHARRAPRPRSRRPRRPTSRSSASSSRTRSRRRRSSRSTRSCAAR